MTGEDRARLDEGSKLQVHPPMGEITELLTFRLARLAAYNGKAGDTRATALSLTDGGRDIFHKTLKFAVRDEDLADQAATIS